MLNAECIGARGRRKQAKPQRKSATNDESDMKATILETSLPLDKGARQDDANHNHVCSENRNGFVRTMIGSKPEYRHIQGPPNLETILRANGSLRKEPNGTRKKESSLQHLLHLDTNGDFPPSLNSSKTPVILVKTVSALNSVCGAADGDVTLDEFFGVNSDTNDEGELVRKRSQVPLSPAAVKSLSEADPGPEQGVKCPQCPAAFAGLPALQEHLEAEHPRPASPREAAYSPAPACAPCNLSFPSKDQLEKHELLHSPNSQVSCKVCNKQFANVYRLQRHMISHDESAVLRKFKCPECEKAFKFKHHLKEHIRIHSGEKPFQCGNCGKRFSHSGSYSSHMTSKKCLVMNLKVSRGRGLGMDKSPVARGLVPKRTNGKGAFQMGPGNGVFPMMPKYGEAAMFPAVSPRSSFAPPSSTPTLHPFYMAAAPTMPPINPYSLPALSHFLEQLALPMAPKREQRHEVEEAGGMRSIKEEVKEEEDNKIDEKDRSSPQSTTGSDLEAVKRILETVNATVTKQLLQANMHKFTSSPSESSSVSPSGECRKDEIDCRHCGKIFRNRIDHHQHERYLCDSLSKSEGLAAKLEDVASDKSATGAGSSDEEDGKDGDMEEEGVTITTQEGADGRKVRVRSLIADEHLAVLKHHYMMNARPKREELAKIAEKIGFPVRVVQVWFQNTRARDRREGRLMQMPYHLFNNVPLLTTALEQPLDLSTKKTRSVSPAHPSDVEAMNLSRRPASPRPHTFPNGLPGRRTPSPLAYLNLHQDEITPARLNRIFSHPGHLGGNGINMLSMDRFVSELQAKSPLALSMMESGRASSSSPGSDKRSWRHGDMTSETEDSGAADAEAFEEAKRGRFLLGNGYPGSDPEAEGQFLCDQCDKAFSKQSSLARHKYEHSGQRPHKCEVCDKAFKHKHHLTEHRRLHSGEKPFQCSKCLKRFSHSGSYSQHMNHRYSYCKPYRE